MQDKLPERKKLILKAVVTDYVITAEPVASKTLVGRYIWDVKSATIRNDMAELADMGYLCQPHTSAGRIPSDMGYRFYVDKLMDSHKIPSRQAGAAKDEMAERILQGKIPEKSTVSLSVKDNALVFGVRRPAQKKMEKKQSV